MADQCSVMFGVLSLHVLVCLTVRLSFFFPSILSLPFSSTPFPCISSTARVAAHHTFRLHLAFLIRDPSTMRVHHDSFHHVISPPPSSMLNSTALSLHLFAAHHLPLAHCAPSHFPLSLFSAVHRSPRAAPPPDSPLPLCPDPPRPESVSHWPKRLAPLGSAGDASSCLLRLMLLLIFFLVTTVPVHSCCSPTSTALVENSLT